MAALQRMAQYVPARREISGEEKDQQNANDLDRLEAEKIDLRTACPRPRPERDQQHGESDAREQRYVAEFSEVALEIDHAERGEQYTAADCALREVDEEQLVAHGIAQADHERETRARQQEHDREKGLVAAESDHLPPQVHGEKCGQEQS